MGNPRKGAGSPDPRWQFAPLHLHICPPFVGKGSLTLWRGWLSGIRSPRVTLGVNPVFSVAVRWKGSGRGRGEANGKPQKEKPQEKEKGGRGRGGDGNGFTRCHS